MPKESTPQLFRYAAGNYYGEVKIIGLNYDYIFSDNPTQQSGKKKVNEASLDGKIASVGQTEFGLRIATNSEDETESVDLDYTEGIEPEVDLDGSTIKDMIEAYTINLVIPATVKLDLEYNYNENGTEYRVTEIENIGENTNKDLDGSEGDEYVGIAHKYPNSDMGNFRIYVSDEEGSFLNYDFDTRLATINYTGSDTEWDQIINIENANIPSTTQIVYNYGQ